jgi:glutamate synthase (NADPH/NADH) large chain
MAFVYDLEEDFEHRINGESVVYQRIETAHWEEVCRGLIEEHRAATQSNWAASISHRLGSRARAVLADHPEE